MNRMIAVALIFAGLCLGQVLQGTNDDTFEPQMLHPLVAAGIDPKDEVAVLGALQRSSEDVDLAIRAAYALRKLPKSAAMIRELNLAAESPNELLMTYAITTLVSHGDRQWVSAGSARLRRVNGDLERIWLAANLARAGRYEGWDVLEDAIVNGQPSEQYTALMEITAFRGMRNSSGKQVNLIDKLDELMQRAPQDRRGAIFQRIIDISEPARPPKTATQPKKP